MCEGEGRRGLLFLWLCGHHSTGGKIYVNTNHDNDHEGDNDMEFVV